MSKPSILINTYKILTPNINNGKRLVALTKQKQLKIIPKQIHYDSASNRYFQPIKNYGEMFEYVEKAAKDFLAHRNNKFDLDAKEFYEFMNNFIEKSGLLPTSEFRIMRNANGKICGGFSSNVHKNDLHVSSFFLDKNSKKRGIMRELFQEIKTIAQKYNCKNITVDVVGNKELKRSERMGFKEIKTNFWQTLLEWNIISKYLLKNKKTTCPVGEFGKNWLY